MEERRRTSVALGRQLHEGQQRRAALVAQLDALRRRLHRTRQERK